MTDETVAASTGENIEREEHGREERAQEETGGILWRFCCYQLDEIPIDSLVALRIMFGLVMAYEALTYIAEDGKKTYSHFAMENFNLKYQHVEWVTRCNTDGMLFVMHVWLVAGLAMAAGALYRQAVLVNILILGWMFCIELSTYLNHYYFTLMVLFLLWISPAERFFSVDALVDPSIQSRTAPRWTTWSIRALQTIVYLYAAAAKVNEDWLRARPLGTWVERQGRMVEFLKGQWWASQPAAYLMSYGGIVYDATVPFLLLFDSTFPIGVLASVFFHGMNKLILNIGIFPWCMLALMMTFCNPDWPARALRALHITTYESARVRKRHTKTPWKWKETALVSLVFLFVAFQATYPLKSYFHSGSHPDWEEIDHKFTWRMMLRAKRCSGIISMYNVEGKYQVFVDDERHVARRQASLVYQNPSNLLQFVELIVGRLRDPSTRNAPKNFTMHAAVACSLNGRKAQLFVDPKHDLSNFDWRSTSDCLSITVPLEPLSAEAWESGVPWKWPWTFSWLFGQWEPSGLLEEAKAEQKKCFEIVAARILSVGEVARDQDGRPQGM